MRIHLTAASGACDSDVSWMLPFANTQPAAQRAAALKTPLTKQRKAAAFVSARRATSGQKRKSSKENSESAFPPESRNKSRHRFVVGF
jgi:hypothetical protein